MKFLSVLGLLLCLFIVFLIDNPKLKTIANRTKCSIVYCAILIVVFSLGTLEIYKMLPTFNSMLVELYEKYLVK